MPRIIGTVKAIIGKAEVKTVDGQLKTLQVGDSLGENEMVYALGADSKVTLQLEGGRTLTLNGFDEILLDRSVFTVLEAGEALDVKALQQLLAGTEAGKLDETAAGEETLGAANAGAEFEIRNDGRGNVSSYLTGTESNPLAVTPSTDAFADINDAPDAINDALTTPEDQALLITPSTLLANDTDPNGNVLTITSVQEATNGTVELVEGSVVFTPNANYNGEASFTYTISDGQGGTDTATVLINVTPVNDAFTDADENVSTPEEIAISGNVLVGTSSVDGAVTVTGFTVEGDSTAYTAGQTAVIAGVGTLTIGELGGYTFTPSTNYNGPVPVATYTMTDGSSGDTSTLTITVTPVNDAPTAVDNIGDTNVITYTWSWNYDLSEDNDYTNEHVTITPINGTYVDGTGPWMGVGPDGSPQQIDPGEGVKFYFDMDIKLAQIEFAPNFSKQDTLNWVITHEGLPVVYNAVLDLGKGGDLATLTISSDSPYDTIEIHNLAEDNQVFSIHRVLASNSGEDSIISGSLLHFTEAELLYGDIDPDGDSLSISDVSTLSDNGATVSWDSTTGHIIYNPNTLQDMSSITEDRFSYEIDDGNGGTDTGYVYITLNPSSGVYYPGETLLIDGDHSIDLSHISDILADTGTTIGQINMVGTGNASLTNISPDQVSSVSDGTLYVNGTSGDSISLEAGWSNATEQLPGYDSYIGSFGGDSVFLHIDEDLTKIIP